VWRNQAPPAVGAKSPQCAALELWPAPSFTTKHAPISSIDRAAGEAIGPYVYVRQKLRRLTRSFELAAEHREG